MLAVGVALCAAGLGLLARLGVAGSGRFREFVPGLVVAGLGLGLAMVAMTVGAMPAQDEVGPAEGGAASGLYNTALQVGGALGVALLAAVADARAGALAHAARRRRGGPGPAPWHRLLAGVSQWTT